MMEIKDNINLESFYGCNFQLPQLTMLIDQNYEAIIG